MTCYGCGETGRLYQVCPKQRIVGGAAAEEPTASWADIAARGKRSQKRNRAEKGEEEVQHNDPAGPVGALQVGEGEAILSEDQQMTRVTTVRFEGTDQRAVDKQDAICDGTARCTEAGRDVEDAMDCGEEMSGTTNTDVECQPLPRYPSADKGIWMMAGEEEVTEERKQQLDTDSVDSDFPRLEEGKQTASTRSSLKRKKDENREERGTDERAESQ